MSQFLRKWKLEVVEKSGVTYDLTGLRCIFEVRQQAYSFPMTAKVQVFNMSRDNVKQVRDEAQKMRLSVAYGSGKLTTLFDGMIRNIVHTRRNEDGISEFHIVPEYTFFDTPFAKTYAAGTPIGTIISDLAKAAELSSEGAGPLLNRQLTSARSFSGKMGRILTDLTKEYDTCFRVFNKTLTVTLNTGEVNEVTGEVFEIGRNSGMVGAPALTLVGADVECLLNPEIKPLDVIKIISEVPTIQGDLTFRRIPQTLGTGYYRAQQVIHRGDTRGNSWTTEIVGKSIDKNFTRVVPS